MADRTGQSMPVTGEEIPELAPFDTLMTSFVEEQKVPGASLAVSHQGRLVYARGFGYSDVERQQPVQPTDLFRIASVSKPITAVAVMQLVEQGKLPLDDHVLARMNLPDEWRQQSKLDPRWEKITIRHCLQHRGGWDRAISFDPIGRPREIADTLGISFPVRPNDIIHYMLSQPLDFDPGNRTAYSNFGYLVLGRIIEVATGEPYEQYVQKQVFEKIGVTRPRLGHALENLRAKGEVRYYDPGNHTAPAIFPPQIGQTVPVQYGAENLDGYAAHGGWIASAVDLVKFADAFHNPSCCKLLSESSIKTMWERPDGLAGFDESGRPRDSYYGCGWSVRPMTEGKANQWHHGRITGTSTLLVRRYDGITWAILFNSHVNRNGEALASLIDGPLHQAANQVATWPSRELTI
ncbi:MAG TPA: serine hydrolase domain-containing protein [Planctomicrobium sp.]|nr:serine hydrolase domain-containing protein [Planctomicrobium sp.]